MEMPRPSDGHRKLEKIANQWEGDETMHPSPWDPQGGKATGRIKSRVALNGFALIYDYEQEREPGGRRRGPFTVSPVELEATLGGFESVSSARWRRNSDLDDGEESLVLGRAAK